MTMNRILGIYLGFVQMRLASGILIHIQPTFHFCTKEIKSSRNDVMLHLWTMNFPAAQLTSLFGSLPHKKIGHFIT